MRVVDTVSEAAALCLIDPALCLGTVEADKKCAYVSTRSERQRIRVIYISIPREAAFTDGRL